LKSVRIRVAIVRRHRLGAGLRVDGGVVRGCF
jgi:hypothetical protein